GVVRRSCSGPFVRTDPGSVGRVGDGPRGRGAYAPGEEVHHRKTWRVSPHDGGVHRARAGRGSAEEAGLLPEVLAKTADGVGGAEGGHDLAGGPGLGLDPVRVLPGDPGGILWSGRDMYVGCGVG